MDFFVRHLSVFVRTLAAMATMLGTLFLASSIAEKSPHFFMNFHHFFIPFPVAFPETGRPDEALTKFLPAMVTLQKGLVGHGPAWHKSLT